MKMLVSLCMRDLNSKKMSWSRKLWAGRMQEGWKDTANGWRDAVGMKTAIEDNKRCNTEVELKG